MRLGVNRDDYSTSPLRREQDSGFDDAARAPGAVRGEPYYPSFAQRADGAQQRASTATTA
jgi:hypothetical protein